MTSGKNKEKKDSSAPDNTLKWEESLENRAAFHNHFMIETLFLFAVPVVGFKNHMRSLPDETSRHSFGVLLASLPSVLLYLGLFFHFFRPSVLANYAAGGISVGWLVRRLALSHVGCFLIYTAKYGFTMRDPGKKNSAASQRVKEIRKIDALFDPNTIPYKPEEFRKSGYDLSNCHFKTGLVKWWMTLSFIIVLLVFVMELILSAYFSKDEDVPSLAPFLVKNPFALLCVVANLYQLFYLPLQLIEGFHMFEFYNTTLQNFRKLSSQPLLKPSQGDKKCSFFRFHTPEDFAKFMSLYTFLVSMDKHHYIAMGYVIGIVLSFNILSAVVLMTIELTVIAAARLFFFNLFSFSLLLRNFSVTQSINGQFQKLRGVLCWKNLELSQMILSLKKEGKDVGKLPLVHELVKDAQGIPELLPSTISLGPFSSNMTQLSLIGLVLSMYQTSIKYAGPWVKYLG